MLSITKDVSLLNPSGNDISLNVATDVDAAGRQFTTKLILSNNDINLAVPGAGIIFTWESGAASLTFPCSISGDGYYPRTSFLNDSSFLDGLVANLASNQAFAQFFDVIREGFTNNIVISARYTGTRFNLTITGTQPHSEQVLITGADQVTGYNIYMDVFQEIGFNSNVFEKVIGLKLFPDAGKIFKLNLKRILENPDLQPSKVFPDIPAAGQMVAQPANRSIQRFYYKINEMTAGNSIGSRITSGIKYLLLAAINQEAFFKDFDLVSHLMQVYTPFLTWYPDFNLVAKDQPHFLYFILINGANYHSGGPTKVQVDITFNDGTKLLSQVVGEIPGLQLWQPYIIPAGVFQLGLQQFGRENIQSYCVFITHNGIRISEKKNFTVDWRCPEDRQFFLFQNSLGGMDTLYCHSRDLGLNIEDTLLERLFHTDSVEDGPAGQYFSLAKSHHRIFTTYTALQSKISLRYLQEFFSSSHIYLVSSSRYIPVILTKNSIDLYKRSPDLQWLPIEYRYGFDDCGYTPV